MRQKLLVIILAFICINSYGQGVHYWKKVSNTEALKLTGKKELFTNTFKLSAYSLFTLDEKTFRNIIPRTPNENAVSISKSSFIISIPVSQNKIEKFRLIETPVMQSGLAEKYPFIKSYTGVGVDNPSSSLYCDITPKGFHAMILSANQPAIYINPVDRKNNLYVVFDRNHISSANKLNCITESFYHNNNLEEIFKEQKITSDGKLRTFRFAVTTGGEFSKLLLTGNETTDAEKKATVLSALVTDLVRTNGIYEADLGIRLQYVNDEDTIIFLDPQTDPFISNSFQGFTRGKWNTESQETIDQYIGTANYDIGHLLMGFSTGGNAGCIGCVCVNGSKGSAVTGYTQDLTSDPFVVDFWDHEIGHQFGANHTFDYAYEGTIAQLEPGSGSTIMGYAGATGNQDLDVQKHSDPYFHGVSIQQITNYIINGSGASCAQITSPGDIAPTANAGADYTIPKSTPFQLTGMATDADASDVLTYCWEQFDVYKKGGTSYKFPDDSSTTGPVFRSYLPDTSKQRIVPKLNSILDGTNENKWEVLPALARDVSFRLTVRDNHAGNGSTANDNALIKVTNAAGPFFITKPSADTTTYNEGNNLTVTWNVANTTVSPVNCSNVNILLSIDGGITFPYTVAASTPNDGSEQITIPIISSSTTKARIKVEAAGNIFFDISNSDLKIKKSVAVDWLSFTAEKSGNHAALLKWSTASEINNDHFEVERSKDKTTFTALANVPAGNFPSQTQNYSYTDNTVESGINYYRLKQVSKDSSFSYSGLAQVTFGASWSIQPNPATDNAKIIFRNQATNIQIALSDAAGKMVYHLTQQSVNANDVITIPVNNLATGVYFLRVITNADSRAERIFVSH